MALTIFAFIFGRRQLKMQEKEHERWLYETSRKLDLRVRGTETHASWGSRGYDPITIALKVKNGSDKTADGFFWEVLIPRHLAFKVEFA